MNRTIYSYDKLSISVVRHTTIIYVYCRVKYDHIGIIMCNTNISIYINTEFDITLINAVKREYIEDRVKQFFLRLKCNTFIGLDMACDCRIYLNVRLVRINIWQNGRRFAYSSRHYIIYNTKTL